MDSTIPRRVISAGSLTTLLARGEATDVVNGARKISNMSYMSRDSADSEATIEIPEELESPKTLEFLELNPATALQVFETFRLFKSQYPDRASLLHVAKEHVRSIAGDALAEGDDWRGVMQRIGLSSICQDRVMDPAFTSMRVAATAKETVCWMMEMRYEFLLSLDMFIQTPAKGPARRVSHLNLDGQLRSGRPEIPARSTSQNKGQPPVGTFPVSAPSISSQDPPLSITGCTWFHKGGTIARLEQLNATGGALAFQRLFSTPPGDFDTPGRVGLYLTKQERVAYQYAQWTSRVVDGCVVPVGILRVAIPNHLLSSICQVVGEDWRDYVWSCRHRDFPPEHLQYLGDYQWLVGPLCRQSNEAVSRMADKSELIVWRVDGGETASHHVTLSPQICQLLNSNCVGKVWITALAAEGNYYEEG